MMSLCIILVLELFQNAEISYVKCISMLNPQTCYKFALSIASFYHTISILSTTGFVFLTYRNQQMIKRITNLNDS